VARHAVREREVHGHLAGEAEVLERRLGDEAERAPAALRIDEHLHGTVEAPLLADEGVEQVLRARVEEPHEREPGERALHHGEEAARQERRGEEADGDEEEDRRREPGARNGEPEPRVERHEQPPAHVAREGERGDDHDAAQEVVDQGTHASVYRAMPDAPTAASARRTLLSWSGGKDSALALHALRHADSRHGARVEALLTTVTGPYERVSMHGVRMALLEAQAAALGVPLRVARIPAPCTNAEYEAAMRAPLEAWRSEGGGAVAFGDLFLADVRAYRERLLAPTGLAAAFPLWGAHTPALARDVVRLGFRAILVCVDPAQLDPAFCGRDYDDALLDALPDGVDACGERGEFHTFVWDGPGFARPVPVARGEVVTRDGFVFQELLPAAGAALTAAGAGDA
jgi:uncharacterized protein (TIGR00290 family)